MGVLRGQRALPVVLLTDVGARAVQTVRPAVEAADERLSRGRRRSWRRPGCRPADGRGACRRCGVRELVWSAAHDDDRVVEDVVGEVVADLGNLLDAADLLPHLAPQLVAFGARVVLRDVRASTPMVVGSEFFGRRFDFDIGHHILLDGVTEGLVL